MFCNHCGAELKESAKYCPHCGTALEIVDVQVGEVVSKAPEPAPMLEPVPSASPASEQEVASASAAEPDDAKRARRAARHRVLGGFPLFLVCLGFVQSIHLFASGVVLVVYALSLQPLYANEWMRYVIYGAAGGYGLAGLFQLISAVFLSRRGKRFLALYVISAIFDVLTLVALLVVFVMGGLSIWPTIANIAVVVVVLVLVLVYCAKSSRLRTFLSTEDPVPTMPQSSDGR